MRLNCGKTEMNVYAETENSVFLTWKTEMNNVNVENGKLIRLFRITLSL